MSEPEVKIERSQTRARQEGEENTAPGEQNQPSKLSGLSTVRDLTGSGIFQVINAGANEDRPLSKVFCCDLLSIAMSRAPEGCAWVTVMGNINTLAVAALTDAACIVLAEGASLDEMAAGKAREQGITVLRTDLPVFDSALEIYNRIHGYD